MLRPQDLLVSLKLVVWRRSDWTYAELAQTLGLSTSATHEAVGRAQQAGLLQGRSPLRRALLDFLEHGVRHVFYVERGAVTRGMPTGVGAPPLRDRLSGDGAIPVWPAADGRARGYALQPLYKSVPVAAKNDTELYEVLALVDALREGGTRERPLAIAGLRDRLKQPGAA